jgi:hypothetical protein
MEVTIMADTTQTTPTQTETTQVETKPAQTPTIDYDKIQSMLEGTLKAKEDTALKAYFRQQGLSQEDAEKAIADFKAKQKESTPDVAALTKQAQDAQAALAAAQIQNAAMVMHADLGVDLATIPYLIKLADTSTVTKDGKVDNEKLKEALNKVLADIPGLKKSDTQGSGGFRQVGAAQNTGGAGKPATKPVATKSWNRFN